MKITKIDVNKIFPNPNQPRQIFDEEKIDSLSKSIAEFGVLQPLSVRKKDDYYELIAGERRLIASKKAGITEIPCILVDVEDKESSIISLIENIQREDLNFYEVAVSYKNIIEQFSLTQSELAKKLSVSQSSIANKLRILKLENNIITTIIDNNLTERHARVLLKIKDNHLKQKALNQIVKNKLNVSDSEKLIDKLLTKEKPTKEVVKNSLKDIRIFTNSVKQIVMSGKDAGLDVDFEITQTDDAYEFTIKVEKDKV